MTDAERILTEIAVRLDQAEADHAHHPLVVAAIHAIRGIILDAVAESMQRSKGDRE